MRSAKVTPFLKSSLEMLWAEWSSRTLAPDSSAMVLASLSEVSSILKMTLAFISFDLSMRKAMVEALAST